jgi:hypothetical protein
VAFRDKLPGALQNLRAIITAQAVPKPQSSRDCLFGIVAASSGNGTDRLVRERAFDSETRTGDWLSGNLKSCIHK